MAWFSTWKRVAHELLVILLSAHVKSHKGREVSVISVPKFYTHPVTVYSFELLARDSLQLMKKFYDIQFGVVFPLKSMNATEWRTVSLHRLPWRGQGAPSALSFCSLPPPPARFCSPALDIHHHIHHQICCCCVVFGPSVREKNI